MCAGGDGLEGEKLRRAWWDEASLERAGGFLERFADVGADEDVLGEVSDAFGTLWRREPGDEAAGTEL